MSGPSGSPGNPGRSGPAPKLSKAPREKLFGSEISTIKGIESARGKGKG